MVKVILLHFKLLLIVADNLHLSEKFEFSVNETNSHEASPKICSPQCLVYPQGEKTHLLFKFLNNLLQNTFHLILTITGK